jgi:hypothetical protein
MFEYACLVFRLKAQDNVRNADYLLLCRGDANVILSLQLVYRLRVICVWTTLLMLRR